MRGDTDGPDARCLSGGVAQPSGFLRYQGEAVNAALVQTLRAELFGRPAPPGMYLAWLPVPWASPGFDRGKNG